MESKKINQLATSVSPQTSDLTIIGDPITGVSKKITLLQIANLFATTGTVSSVAVTETGDALTITGSPITSAGTINIGFAGDATQYVRGDGALADFPTSTGGGSSVSYYLNSSVSQGTIGGVAYRELSKDPISGAGTDITISADGYVASYITDANDPALLEVPGGNFNCEFYFSVNSNAHNPYVYAELYKYDGTTFTLLGSSQSVPEYLTNGTTLSPYYFAIPVAVAALSVTDRLAIRIYVNVDGRVVTLHTENNHLCQVVTTFSKGLISLNNLTRQNQFFGTGTSGTDFAITSSTATHTFNLPVASAANTGKLSSSDWSVFNSKEPAITAGTTLQYYRGDKTFQTLNTTAVVEATNLYFTDARSRSALSFAAGSGAYNSSTGVITIPTNNNQITNGSNFITLGSLSGGTGISYNNTTGVITNSAPDQTVSLANGAGISVTGTYPSFTIASTITQYTDALARAAISLTTTGTSGAATYNSTTGVLNVPNYAPDLSGYVPTSRTLTINGTAFDLSANRSWSVGTVTSVAASAGTGISVSGSPITTSGTLTITNTAPDQVVALTASTGISISGTYPNFTITNTSPSSGGTVTSVGLSSATSGVTIGSSPITTSGTITLAIATASGSQNGLLSSTDWTTFNSKQGTITLTTTGTSGAATFSSNTLNIPNYGSALSAYLPLAGGTLTGALSGTSATFSSSVTNTSGMLLNVGATGTNANMNYTTFTNGVYSALNSATPSEGVGMWSDNLGNGMIGSLYNNTASSLNLVVRASSSVSGLIALKLSGTGAATFSSSITAGGIIRANASVSGQLVIQAVASDSNNSIYLRPNNSGFNLISSNYLSASPYLPLSLSARENNADLVLATNGNVGIGTTTVGSTLQVNGNAAIGYSASTAAPTNGLVIEGITLIGTTTANSYGLNTRSIQINGTDGGLLETRYNGTAGLRVGSGSDHSYHHDPRNAEMRFATNDTTRFYIYGNGNYDFTGSDVSDRRAKENIATIDLNATNKIMQLEAKSYNMKNNPSQKRYGFIAQDVREVVADLISGNDKDGYIGLDYNGLLALAIKAIQEQQIEIQNLKQKVYEN